jgi:SAM-dependent methyltransferase
MNNFWEDRFFEEGKIWGDCPSTTATYACELFNRAHVHHVLIPGSGYGRNAMAFYSAGFRVTGIEMSNEALKLAQPGCAGITYYHGSVLDMPYDESRYDGIYCFNVLHLFREKERALFLQKCIDQLKEGGVVFFVVFSDKENSFGKGMMVEHNTFESKPGRTVHYYSENDMKSEFKCLKLLETGIMEDPEEHGDEGVHTHVLRYIYAKK